MEFWNPKSLGYLFFAEAKRLWEVETLGESSLVTMQAALVFQILYIHCGLDKLANTCTAESIRMSKDLGLMEPTIDGESIRYKRSRCTTIWYLFWVQRLEDPTLEYMCC
jgi:hypothetical protein